MIITPEPCARNNAGWCDEMCKAHGVVTEIDATAWTARTRPPQFYPDAVTLVPDVGAPDLLARVNASPGCSVKDSFASMSLDPFGFRVLFDAQWIARERATDAPTTDRLHCDVVRTDDELLAWERAWSAHQHPSESITITTDNSRMFPAALLCEPSVVMLAMHAGTDTGIVSGAVLNSASGVVGVSNVFGPAELLAPTWATCVDEAAHRFGPSPLVGYESGEALEVARQAGFQTVGPLRVWIMEDVPS